MVCVVNGVPASGVDMDLEKDLAGFALQEMKIHPLMLLIQTLLMIFQMFLPTLHNLRHTRASYVGTILTTVMIVHLDSRLSMSRNRATIKTLCQPRNQNFYEPNLCYNSNSSGFDQSPEYSIDHQPHSILEDLNQQRMNDEYMENLKQHYLDEMLSLSNDLQIKDYRNEKIDIHFRRECESMIDENKESTIRLNEIVSQIPPSIAITPVLPTLELENSFIMGNEELSTIPEKESDEFIKSSVEDLVPIPSKSEDTSESDSVCDLPSCDDFSLINVYEEKSMNFSNPLFDSNEILPLVMTSHYPMRTFQKIMLNFYSEPLFKFNDEYTLSDVNPLLMRCLETHRRTDLMFSNLDEQALLVTPLSDVNKDECFNPGGDIDEIDAFLDMDISTDRILKMIIMTRRETLFILRVCLIMTLSLISLLRIARIMKTLVLVVLSIVHSIFNP
ncbi:hypothetical protein Tco_1300975 [Tanacetum coccineum]